MNTKTLMSLLIDRGLNGKVQVSGDQVIFYDSEVGRTKFYDAPNESPYDTPENRAIVEDVIANYDTLVAEYEAEQEKIVWNNAIYAKLAEIDAKSIRSMRDGDTQYIERFKQDAIVERAKLK